MDFSLRLCAAVATTGRQRGLLPRGEASAKGVSPMSDCRGNPRNALPCLCVRYSSLNSATPDLLYACS
ncbi:hypothetical protein F8S12_09155 [Nostoc sp. WHI]|nr:hypothetical protein [Nostoc sp. WHI]